MFWFLFLCFFVGAGVIMLFFEEGRIIWLGCLGVVISVGGVIALGGAIIFGIIYILAN